MSDSEFDVLIVGGGPSGSACAAHLAAAGHEVLVVEKKTFPREKTCGDGLTPRAMYELDRLGIADDVVRIGHRFTGLRSMAFGKTLELEWPSHPDFPDFGVVVTRHDLDARVAGAAEKAGATLWQGAEATGPVFTDGLVTGATVKRKDSDELVEVKARFVVAADGANSRFGRALGAVRDRSYPQGMAIRGYFDSPRHAEPWIESHLDIRDRSGNVLPGYGWIFPVGDGRVNVGVGLLSTFSHWKDINTTHLMEAFVDHAPESWDIRPETACGPPTGGRLPMGLSVGPRVGPSWLLIGDAGGSINPFNGEGIAYAYESGRLAAEALDEALRYDDGLALQGYERRVQAEWGRYFKVARAFVKVIGRPEAMKVLVSTGMNSRTLMEWVLRIMANILRPDELGPAEAAYKAVAALARFTP
jgi:menaquinone-9 beta-reductase